MVSSALQNPSRALAEDTRSAYQRPIVPVEPRSLYRGFVRLKLLRLTDGGSRCATLPFVGLPGKSGKPGGQLTSSQAHNPTLPRGATKEGRPGGPPEAGPEGRCLAKQGRPGGPPGLKGAQRPGGSHEVLHRIDEQYNSWNSEAVRFVVFIAKAGIVIFTK